MAIDAALRTKHSGATQNQSISSNRPDQNVEQTGKSGRSRSILGSLASALPRLPHSIRFSGKRASHLDGVSQYAVRSSSDPTGIIPDIRSSASSSSSSVDIERSGSANSLITSRQLSKKYAYRTVYTLVPGKLSMAFHPNEMFSRTEIKRRPDLYFFSSDLHESYIPFCKDFGPVSIVMIHRFWLYVRSKEHHPGLRGRPLVYYTGFDPKDQANAAVLLAAYMMIEHRYTAAHAILALSDVPTFPFSPFCDATWAQAEFGLQLEDVCRGLERAMSLGWYDPNTFDIETFEHWEDPENGDMSHIGDKFVAFRGPQKFDHANPDHGKYVHTPNFYAAKLRKLGVKTVIRLNESWSYEKEEFEPAGITVEDMEFEDCSTPPSALVDKFLQLCEDTPGKIAVHCKAGLGRTGTMIGLWLMKHHGFTGREAIAWLRLCRPGSVIGRQQQFLCSMDGQLFDKIGSSDGSFKSPRRKLLVGPGSEKGSCSFAGATEQAKSWPRGVNSRPVLAMWPKQAEVIVDNLAQQSVKRPVAGQSRASLAKQVEQGSKDRSKLLSRARKHNQ